MSSRHGPSDPAQSSHRHGGRAVPAQHSVGGHPPAIHSGPINRPAAPTCDPRSASVRQGRRFDADSRRRCRVGAAVGRVRPVLGVGIAAPAPRGAGTRSRPDGAGDRTCGASPPSTRQADRRRVVEGWGSELAPLDTTNHNDWHERNRSSSRHPRGWHFKAAGGMNRLGPARVSAPLDSQTEGLATTLTLWGLGLDVRFDLQRNRWPRRVCRTTRAPRLRTHPCRRSPLWGSSSSSSGADSGRSGALAHDLRHRLGRHPHPSRGAARRAPLASAFAHRFGPTNGAACVNTTASYASTNHGSEHAPGRRLRRRRAHDRGKKANQIAPSTVRHLTTPRIESNMR